MNDFAREVFNRRRTIIDNAETLVKYGKKFQKNSDTNQLSLFSADTIELEKPKLPSTKLDERELEQMSDLELESIGLTLTYNKYDKHILNERIINTTNINDVVYCTTNNTVMDFIAEVVRIEHRVSTKGNDYVKVHYKRDSLIFYAFLNGKIMKNNIRDLFVGRTYITRVRYNNGFHSIINLMDTSELNLSKKIKDVKVTVPNKENLFKIRNYIFAKMRDRTGLSYKFNVLDTDYRMEETISITGEQIAALENRGAIVELIT